MQVLVPFLSPVRTQILISALARVAMVSGTPSCSLSSMAVAPISLTERESVQPRLQSCCFIHRKARNVSTVTIRQTIQENQIADHLSTGFIATFRFRSILKGRSSRWVKVLHLPWGSSQSPHTLGRERRPDRSWPAEPLGVSWTRLQTRWRWCLCNTSTASSRWRWQTPGANDRQEARSDARMVSEPDGLAKAAATSRHEGRGNSRPEPSGWLPCIWSWGPVARRWWYQLLCSRGEYDRQDISLEEKSTGQRSEVRCVATTCCNAVIARLFVHK